MIAFFVGMAGLLPVTGAARMAAPTTVKAIAGRTVSGTRDGGTISGASGLRVVVKVR